MLKIIFCLFSKKLVKTRKTITESLIYYRYFLKYLKRFWTSNCLHTLNMSLQNFNVILGRKKLCSQGCLLHLTEKWKDAVWKTLDCLSYDLLIAKLNSYGVSLTSLKLLIEYLINLKANSFIVFWKSLNSVSPKGYWTVCHWTACPLLGTLLYNSLLCDLFLMLDKT